MSEDTLIGRLIDRLSRVPPLVVGDTAMTYDADLEEHDLVKAERELRETPEVVQESFKILCDLLSEEEDLYLPLDIEFLQQFLRRCKWYPKSAFKLIKRFYEYQQCHPEYFGELRPSNERAAIMAGLIIPLPRRSAEGCRIVIVHAGQKWDPKEVSIEQIFRGIILCLEVANTEPKTQIAGVCVIIDMEGLTLNQVTYFTPTFASDIFEFVHRSLPCRMKGMHIVNQSYVFDMAFAVFRPFLKGKIRDRMFFHGTDKSSILAHLDAKCVPKRYGGDYDMEDPSGEDLYNYSCAYDDYFDEIGRFGYVKEL